MPEFMEEMDRAREGVIPHDFSPIPLGRAAFRLMRLLETVDEAMDCWDDGTPEA